MKILTVIFLVCMLPKVTYADLIHEESFEDPESPSTYELTGDGAAGFNSYFIRTDDSSPVNYFPEPSNEDGSFYIIGEATMAISSFSAATLAPVSVANYTDLSVTVALAEAGADFEEPDFMEILYQFDGGSFISLAKFNGRGSGISSLYLEGEALISANQVGVDDFKDWTFAIPDAGDDLVIRVRMSSSANGEEMAFDHVRINGALVPEPGTYALMASMILIPVLQRRKATLTQ